MDVQAWDSVFVRARRVDIHGVLEQVGRWGSWWPGMRTEPVAAGPLGLGAQVVLRPPGLLRRPQRYTVEVVKNRKQRALGLDLRYSGDLVGAAELYYLDETAGSVVTYLLRATIEDRRWRGVLADHRAGMRAGLDALKDRFERDRTPGSEPEADLLRDQQAAMLDFRRGIEEWNRKQAAKDAATAEPHSATVVARDDPETAEQTAP